MVLLEEKCQQECGISVSLTETPAEKNPFESVGSLIEHLEQSVWWSQNVYERPEIVVVVSFPGSGPVVRKENDVETPHCDLHIGFRNKQPRGIHRNVDAYSIPEHINFERALMPRAEERFGNMIA